MAFLPTKKEHSWVLWLQTFLMLNCLSEEVMMVSAARLFETFAKKPFPRQLKLQHRFSAVFVSNIH